MVERVGKKRNREIDRNRHKKEMCKYVQICINMEREKERSKAYHIALYYIILYYLILYVIRIQYNVKLHYLIKIL